MTAFNRNDIPANISSLEQLIVWAGAILNFVNPTTTAIEGTSSADAQTVRITQFSPFFVSAVSTDQHWRAIGRFSFRLGSEWVYAGNIWEAVQQVSSAEIPTEFKV